MESRINITAEAGGAGLVEIFGRIGFDWWKDDPEENTAKRVAEKLAELKDCESVTVRINSLGGDVDTALAIHGMLKECKNVTTEAVGMVASAATVIFMAGETRKINKSALFLVHKCMSTVYAGNENDLESELETQRTINDTMAEIYTEGGVSAEKVTELMEANHGEGKWITANEAQRYGFATEVVNGSKRDAEARKVWSAEDLAAEGLPMTSGLVARLGNLVRDILRENNNPDNMKKEDKQPVAEGEPTPTPQNKPAEAEAENERLTAELEASVADRDRLTAEVAAKEAENEQLKARVAELEAVMAKTPEGAGQPSGDDAQVEGKENFADWQKKQGYYNEVKAEVEKRRMFNN